MRIPPSVNRDTLLLSDEDKSEWVKFIAETTFHNRRFKPEEVKPPGPPPWGILPWGENDNFGHWRYYFAIKDGPWLSKYGESMDPK